MSSLHLHFGLQYDHIIAPRPLEESGVLYAGPQRLLLWLEQRLGLAGHADDNDHLRIASWRSLLEHYLARRDDVWYRASFEADPLATAADLLSKRDELIGAGWSFRPTSDMPNRLRVWAELEQLHREGKAGALPPGRSDRLEVVIAALQARNACPFASITLAEPISLLPPAWQRLFGLWPDRCRIHSLPKPQPTTDLGRWQLRLLGQSAHDGPQKQNLQGDGSLLILRSRRARDAAAFWAVVLRRNAALRPLMVVTADDRMLDTALVREGLPGMGIPSSSQARPPLQLLKLAMAFLWEPIQVERLLEFVSLPIKPLDEALSLHIARHFSTRPGIEGPEWQATINQFFKKAEAIRPTEITHLRSQFQFWFARKRYAAHQEAPLADAKSLYDYIQQWAQHSLRQQANRYPSLFILAQQARKVSELLELWPKRSITQLELERIVRTIFEPAPASFQPEEAGHLPWVSHPGAVCGPIDEVCWWNFVEFEPSWFFDSWTRAERQYLAAQGVCPTTPQQQNARQIFHRTRPVLWARRRVILIIPDEVDGQPTLPHPLWSELTATFDQMETITAHTDAPHAWRPHIALPSLQPIASCPLPQPVARIHFRPVCPPERPVESLSSLETLCYYPHIWLFRYWLELESAPLLHIVDRDKLMGNLAHRLFEQLLAQKDVLKWSHNQLSSWIEDRLARLMRQEAVSLLQYGCEPERIALQHHLSTAAWRLLDHLRHNGWQIAATEQPLQGPFADIELRGVADLVLQRGSEWAVIDLKWSGKTFRIQQLKNQEDLQLTCYARLVTAGKGFAHSAYFILKQGVLLCRDKHAFAHAHIVGNDSRNDQQIKAEIWQKMEHTWRWRMAQLSQGLLEIRTEATKDELDRHPDLVDDRFDAMSLLEMKSTDPPFDDYKVLIGLVE